jgi:hypothetical protein
MNKKIIGIAFLPDKTALKYNLINKPRSINSFERFLAKKGAMYVNYYNKENRAFIRRAIINSAINV